MRLSPVAYPAHETIRGVRFAMLDITVLVTILVTHAALDGIEAPGPASGTYLARFEKQRDKFEQIASSKHQRGQVEINGAVMVDAGDLGLTS
jgi:uncharacterized protein DUF1488